MISLNSMRSDIFNLVYGGKVPDDADLSERLVEYYIESYRAMLIKQELSTRGKIPENYVQTICVNLEPVEKSECCGDFSECKVLRSTEPLPKIINSGGKSYVVAVSSADGEYAFTMIPFYRAKWSRFNAFTKNKNRAYLKENYLYIIHSMEITKVAVSAIFENPSELSEYSTCEDKPCFSEESAYPITGDLAVQITDMILKYRVAVLKQFPKDTTNDMQDAPKATK